jgi:hypothetical protein
MRGAAVAAADPETSAGSARPPRALAVGGAAATGSIAFERPAAGRNALESGGAATGREAGFGTLRRLAAGLSNRAAAARVRT